MYNEHHYEKNDYAFINSGAPQSKSQQQQQQYKYKIYINKNTCWIAIAIFDCIGHWHATFSAYW